MVKGTELSKEQLNELIGLIALEYPTDKLQAKFHIGFDRLNNIKNKYDSEIQVYRGKLALEREKQINPMLISVVYEGLKDICDNKGKIRSARFGELSRGIEALYKSFRLSNGQSTDNVLVAQEMDTEQLKEFILNGNMRSNVNGVISNQNEIGKQSSDISMSEIDVCKQGSEK